MYLPTGVCHIKYAVLRFLFLAFFRDAVKGLHGTTLHGSVLRIEISANNKNKLGPRGGYRERKELSYDGRASIRCALRGLV